MAFIACADFFDLFGADITRAIGDFFRARHHQPLPLLDRLDVETGFHQRLMRARIEPGHASAHDHHFQLAALEVRLVHVGDFQFAAGARPQRLRDPNHLVVVKIEPGYGVT